jgi:hypothetical protein
MPWVGIVGPEISPDALRSAYDPHPKNVIALANPQVGFVALPENLPPAAYPGRMDRYRGLRGDADEQLRRAVRDGFKRAGLMPAQVTQALEWYRDAVRPGMDEAKLIESFNEFAAAKAWPEAEGLMQDAQTAAAALGQKLVVVKASTESDLDLAFTTLVQQRIGAVLVPAEPFLFSRRERLVALAARHTVPAIYSLREFVDAGGLMSYGPSNVEGWRLVAVYTGRILKGEKPADLPVQQSIKFEFVINHKTVRMLGIDVPPTLLALADEVID